MTLPRIAVLAGDPIGARMAGPAIRAVELSRALVRAGHPVALVTPEAHGARPPGVEVIEADGGEAWAEAVEGAHGIVGFSAVVADHPWLGDLGVPLVVDAYDPGLLETIERFRGAPVNEQREWIGAATRHLVEPLASADLVLVASERQRHLMLGLLAAAGRLNGRTAAEDPTLRGLCAVVPFGVSAEPPRPRPSGPLRGGPDGLGDDAVIALWGGGLYDWLDPLTLVEAVGRCEEPIVAVFLAGPHPTAAVGHLPLVDRARRRARELGLLNGRVRFVEEWVPYADRGAWLLDADIGVSLHHDHVETTFAFRTRILDYLWAGLPVLCSAGDHFAEVVAADDLGVVVPVGDTEAVAAGLRTLASTPAAARSGRRSRTNAAAQAHRWEQAAQPLVAWCAAPQLAADRRVGPEPGRRRRLRPPALRR